MQVRPAAGSWTVVAFLAVALVASFPSVATADVSRAQAARKALTALDARKGDDGLIVFGDRRSVRAGAVITQAGPNGTPQAAGRVPTRLARAGVKGIRAPRVLTADTRSWFFYADEGPNQSFEHPGRVVLVERASGEVHVSDPLRWVPLVDGRRPVFFRSSAAYQGKRYRIFDRPWKQKAQAAAKAKAAALSAAAESAQERFADALAAERSCALRVSDTLGDFYDFGRVDKTRASIGRVLKNMARRNPGFRTGWYQPASGRSAPQVAQGLIDAGCKDLFLYVAGNGTRGGNAVVGIRSVGGGALQSHTLDTAAVEALIKQNAGVTFKLAFDVPFAGRIAQRLTDEKNVTVLLTSGGADEQSYSYLPQILGPNGLVRNTQNPFQLLEFTNVVIRGMERFVSDPAEMDHAIAEQAAGRTDSVLAWWLARSLQLGPSPFSNWLLGKNGQRVPLTSAASSNSASSSSPINHRPNGTTPAQVTREDTPRDITLTATDPDGDPMTFTVLTPPTHGTLTGTAPFLRYAPDRDYTGDDELTYRVSDGRGGTDDKTVRINVTPDNDVPSVISGPAILPPTFTENGAAVVVDAQLQIVDPDSTQLTGARIDVVSGFVPGDELDFTPAAGITGTYDTGTGVLTLSGTASLTAYRDALRSVTFDSTSDDPGTQRSIRFRADDASANGVPTARPVTVVPANDAPVLSTPSAQTVAEDATLAVPAVSFTDPDARTGPVQADLEVADGTLDLTATSGLTFTTGDGTDDAHLVFTGTPAAVNTALGGVAYTGDQDFVGSDQLDVEIDDLGNTPAPAQTDTAAVGITVSAVNDAPVNSVPSAQTLAEDASLTMTSAFSIADVDAAAGAVTTHVAVDHGVITVSAGGTVTNNVSDDVTISGTVAQVNASLSSIQYAPSGDYAGADTITVTTDDQGNTGDGGSQTDTDTVAVTVTAVNDAPVLTAPAAPVNVNEDTPKTFTAGGPTELSVADVDAGTDPVQITLTASAGTLSMGLDPDGISAGNGTDTLTLTGTLTQVNDALDGLEYTPAQDASGAATIGVSVTDQGATGSGGALTDSATVDLAIAAINDAPTVTPATDTVAYTEDAVAAPVAGDAVLADVDDTDLDEVLVAITADRQTGDTLTFVNTAAVVGTYNSGTGVLTLAPAGASATLAEFQSALRTVTFSTTNDDPTASRTISITADDGDDVSAAATRTVTITPANDAPTVTASAGSAAFTEDGTPVAVDPAVTVADADDTNLEGATIAITANHVAGTDVLSFADQNGITVQSWTPATGTLVLTGSASEADYETALRAITFHATGDTPSTATRTVSFTVTDGDAPSSADTRDVTVDDVNDAPVNTVPGAQEVDEDSALTFDSAKAISVADVDAAAGDELEVTLTVTGGTFDLSQTTGLTFSSGDGDDDAAATFTGTQADLNAALDGLVYTPTPGTSGARQLQLATSDQGHTGGPAETDSDTVAITVKALNRAPVNNLPSAQTVDEDDDLELSTANGNAISITDVDAGSGVIETAIGVTNGTATLSQTTGLTFLNGSANGTSFLQVEGTLADINAALDGLTYAPAADYSGSAQLDIATEDRGNTGVGGNKTDSDALGITVSAVNDAPTASAPATATVAEEETVTFSTGNVNALTVGDIDAGGANLTVDLTVTDGTVTLGGVAGLTVTGNGTAHVTATGSAVNLNAGLEGTTYAPDVDHDGPATLTLDVSDNGNTGSGGALTASDTTAITVTGKNDAPVLTAPTTASVNQNGSRTFSTGNGNAISIADVDAGADDVEVTLGVAHGTLSTNGTAGLTFTTGDGTDDAALVFTGTLTDVNAALDGLVYEPTAAYFGADQLDVDVSDLGNNGAGGPLTDSADVAITVNEANTAPVNTVPGAQTFDEDTTKTFTGADKLAVFDDNVDASTGELEVDLDVDHGVLTLDGTSGLTFTAGDGTNDPAMTFKGSPDAINAALDGMTYTPDLNATGSDTLTLLTDDLGASGPPGALTDTDTVALNVTAVNDAPAFARPASITADEDVQHAIAGLNLFDVDAGGGTMSMRLAVTNGTLTLGTTTDLTFVTGDGSGDAEIVAEGTRQRLDEALGSLSYTGAGNYTGSDTLVLEVTDNGHTGSGGALTDAENVPITVSAVNDAPVNSVPGAQTIDEDTTLTLSGASAPSVADVDAASVRVTLTATNGTLALSTLAGLTFSTGDGTGDSTMTFTGTKAAVNTALDGLVYTPTANFNGAASITLLTEDLGATGSGGAQSDSDSINVTVTAVNDAPVLTQPDAAALTYTEDTPSENHEVAIAPNLTLADVDDTNIASATVTLATHATGDDLTFTNQNGISSTGYNTGTGVLTLTGSATKANYETALRSVKFRTTSEHPDETQRTITFRANDGHGANNLSNQVTRAIDVVRTNDAPVADDETFSGTSRAIGNTTLVVNDPTDAAPDPTGPQKGVTGDILDGDTDVDSTGLTITPVTNAPTTGGGRITIEADGDFHYLPEQGCGDTTDTYAYSVEDNHPSDEKTDTGTLTFSLADCVWYVDAAAGAAPTATGGTSQLPYNTLADLDGAGGAGDEDGANHRIFLYDGTYSGGLPLENGQHLLGQRHGLTVSDGGAGTTTLEPAGGGNSQVNGGVGVVTDNTLQGIHLGSAAGAALSGASVGTLTMNTVTSGGINNTTGGAVDITGSGNALDVALTELSSNGGTHGVRIHAATGTFTTASNSGTLTNATGAVVDLDGGTLAFTLNSAVADDAGQLVKVNGATGGTKDFNGALSDAPFDGDGTGVSLTGNTGATIRLDGGLNLSTGTANAFAATGGGTVAVADPASTNNTIDTTTGTPLTVTNTTIHADDLTFERIASNGAANGIVLNTTGANGDLFVTGNGGSCTIASPTCTGGTIQSSTGAGVVATSVGGGISLTRTRVLNGQDDGIRATTVADLKLDNAIVQNNGNVADENGLDYTNVTGNPTVTSSVVTQSEEEGLRLANNTGTTDMDINASTFSSSRQGDGIELYGDGNANIKADITNSTFAANKDDGLQWVTPAGGVTPTLNLNFLNNGMTADASHIPAGALLTLSPHGSSTTRANVVGNTLGGSKGSAMILNAAGTSSFDATVSNNSITSAGGIGIWPHMAQSSTSKVQLTNNAVSNYAQYGIYASHSEGTTNSRADFIIQSNVLTAGATSLDALILEAGALSTDVTTVCADIGGAGGLANNFTNASRPGFNDIMMQEYAGNTLLLPGLAPFGTNYLAYFQSRNTGVSDVTELSVPPNAPGTTGSCNAPSLPPAP